MSGAGTVRCLRVRAQIADAGPEIRRARGYAVRGDASWQHRLQRYERDETMIVAVTACAVIDGDGERSQAESLCFCHEAVWTDRLTGPGALAKRLRALARRDFRTVGARLRDGGVRLSAREDKIAVALVIDSAVAEGLDSTGARR